MIGSVPNSQFIENVPFVNTKVRSPTPEDKIKHEFASTEAPSKFESPEKERKENPDS